MINFVLSKFTKDELIALDNSFNDVASACDLFIKNDFNKMKCLIVVQIFNFAA